MSVIKEYKTGDEVPDDAKYMHTIARLEERQDAGFGGWKKCFIVIHYFLVEE